MITYHRLASTLLFRLEAEAAHDWTLRALDVAQRSRIGRSLLARFAGPQPATPVKAFGLRFPNLIGVAAGFDKDARVVAGLAALGFGHVEVGTLTPRPQVGNPKPRIFRLPHHGALINRMGFPNRGATAAARKLEQRIPNSAIVGVSLGKQKDTPLGEALEDYVSVMREVFPYADYLAVNVSSPNTPGLRELQGREYLSELLAGIQNESSELATRHGGSPRPLLVKISPDLTWQALDELLDAALQSGVSGVVATNTSVSRAGVAGRLAAESGGLSGLPLLERSREVVDYITRQTHGRLPVIGVGGIRTAAHVRAMLDAGAILVQVYTGLVYEGPGMAGRILRSLA